MKGLYHTGATELHDIFLAPLQAVIDAEISLSKKIKKFIWKTGFTASGEIRKVNFKYIVNGKVETINIPVLSIVTLPLLGIKDAEFDLHVKMLTVAENHDNPIELPSLLTEKQPKKENKVGLKGYLTPHENLTEANALKTNMRVKLNMKESSMPGGIIKILALLNGDLTNKKDENE